MLWFGLRALVRNAGAFAVFLGVDVVGQAVLVWAVPIESAGRVLWISSLVLSVLLHLICGSYLLYCAVEATRDPSGRLGSRDVLVGGGERLLGTSAVLVAVGAVVAAGLWAFTWVGVAVLLALGFVPLAAAAGEEHPFRAGIATLAHDPLRYAKVVVVGSTVLAAVMASVALAALFWPTPLAQVVVLVAEGCVLLWLACSMAALHPGRTGADVPSPDAAVGGSLGGSLSGSQG